MAIDSPAKIVIIGAGPIGLEAALYARFLGYEVDVFERDVLASSLRQSSAEITGSFVENATSLGLAALEAQGEFDRPADDATLTSREFAERYCGPLANTDLIQDCIHEHSSVVRVTLNPNHSNTSPDDTEDDEITAPKFIVHYNSPDAQTATTQAHVVIDASGENSAVDWTETQLASCPDTGIYLGGQASFGATREQWSSPENLVTREQHGYVIGRKSFGNEVPFGKSFTLPDGHEQIRVLFSILGDRAELDLYKTVRL
ncbi:MAG: NAD-binding protein [Planctomycetales bacterium]|nr:NAD-binding protein [Planctomycetales bacterium]